MYPFIAKNLNLAQLPGDVLMYILQYCDLKDHFIIQQVSRTFYDLSQLHRSYWIDVLKRSRAIKPIAAAPSEDLTKHNIDALKRITLHTLRLERNWSQPEAEIKGPIKAILLGDTKLDIVFQVPGTGLYILHSRETYAITCWDIRIGAAVSSPIQIGMTLTDVSPGIDERGTFSMGILARDAQPIYSLTIVSVQYNQPAITMQVTFHRKLAVSLYYWAAFIIEDVIGVLQIAQDQTIDIIAFNRQSDKEVVIHTDIPSEGDIEDGHSGTSSFGGDLFILVECNGNSTRYRCPKILLPFAENKTCQFESRCSFSDSGINSLRWTLLDDSTIGSSRLVEQEQLGALSGDSLYGVPAVSLHRSLLIRDDILVPIIHVRFWTQPNENYTEDGPPPTLLPACQVNVPGELWCPPTLTWQLILMPYSGLEVILVVKHENTLKLLLVRYHPKHQNATIHRLHVPPFIDMTFIYGLSLDDHLGVVTLLDNRGILFVIPYA